MYFKALHVAGELSQAQVSRLASLSNVTHMNEALDNICVVRVVGTPGHKRVKDVRNITIVIKFVQARLPIITITARMCAFLISCTFPHVFSFPFLFSVRRFPQDKQER